MRINLFTSLLSVLIILCLQGGVNAGIMIYSLLAFLYFEGWFKVSVITV
jgi:hypothetical protein